MYSYEEALKKSVEYFNQDELAAKVFVDKYALRDDDNNILESNPDEMHHRIAKEFARIEKAKFADPLSEDRIYNLLYGFKYIIPQGSILYGCGNPYQTVSLSNCVYGECLVYTRRGMVKMKDIVVGDYVLTHKNRFKKVLRHWSNGIKPTYTISRTFSGQRQPIRTKYEMARFLSVTENHKLYTEDSEWVSVSDIKNQTNKRLKQPRFDYNGNVPSVFPIENGKHVYMDNEFAWIMGMYLAEGAVHKVDSNHPNIYFTLHKNEYNSYAKRICEFSENILGYSCYIQEWEDYNFIQVNISSPEFAKLIVSIFGYGFKDKKIPDWVFGLNKDIKISLLDGFLSGDATNYESFDDDYNIFVIANPTMAYQLGLLSRSLDKNVRFNLQTKGKLIKNRSVATTISNSIDKCYFTKSPVEVEVFDMEVEDDHSFVAGDIICHNCYVVESPYDSYGGITRTDQQLVQISKRRGGVGIDLSTLRPRGSKTKNAARSSTGIVSWMERFSNSIREVGQDGRRGALMLTISVHHPDILDFITIKNDPTKVTGANISVRLSDEFLKAVDEDLEYELRFPVNSNNIAGKIKAKDVWNKIIHSAWLRAEPGLLFWDNIRRYNAVDCYSDDGFETVSTNPCSELPLCVDDSCRLLIQNLFSYVLNPFTSSARFDFNGFAEHTKVAQRLMDDVIDLELEKIDLIIQKITDDPEPVEVKRVELELWQKIREKCLNGRRTGLGITGLGDTLAALGLKYDSEEALKTIDDIFMSFKVAAIRSSVEMAKELGPFPIWDWEKEKDSPWLLNLLHESTTTYEDIRKYGRRNIGHLTIAPTGSMSLLTQTTSGVEPLFRHDPYIRRKKINPSDKNAKVDFVDPSGDSWQEFKVYHPKMKMWMEITGETDLTKSPWYNACAEDINWINRVRLQGVIQKYIDHAISSTINLPEFVTEEEVGQIYLEAWRHGLKGITVYRNNCRTGVLVDKKEEPKAIIKRPKKLVCDIHHPTVKGVKYYVAIGLTEDGQVYEIFAGDNGIDKEISKGFIQRIRNGRYSLIADNEVLIEDMGERCSNEEEAVARLASIALRNGVPIQDIVDQLEKVRGNINIFAKALNRVLKKYIPNDIEIKEKCPECKGALRYESGCKTCAQGCGWSKCS